MVEGVQQQNIPMKDAWDTYAGIALADAAMAHTELYTFQAFEERIRTVQDPKTREMLTKLCCFYGIQKVLEKPNYFLENDYFTGKQFKLFQEAKEQLMREIRPYMIALTDGFMHTNENLGALGREDGKVYESLWDLVHNQNKYMDRQR